MGELQKQIHRIFGNSASIQQQRGVGGGCINDTSVLLLNNGEKVFLKKNTRHPKGMFEAEAEGLKHLRTPGGPRVPEPFCVFEDETHQYLLLEYLPSAGKMPNYWEAFGTQLATMHQTVRRDSFGFDIDNYIGATPQRNDARPDWVAFFAEMRLQPQIKMAGSYLSSSIRKKLDALLESLDRFIDESDGDASIIHGDLWTGNAMVGPGGEPVVIDPATYYGHREAEIAMTMLFGRFGGRFYDAYNEVWPMAAGWQERMDLYNLYHMLNHVNLFGAGYLGSVSSIVNHYV